MVAVVAQREIFALRHHQFALADKALHLLPPERVHLWIGINRGRKVVAEGIAGSRFKCGVGFTEHNTVHPDSAIADAQPVAGQAHYPLDEIVVLGVVEDNNVAARNLAIGHDQPAEAARRSINLLVDQQKIAHQQGVFHALGGNKVRLKHKGEQK